MLAAENGNLSAVWALLRAGADPEARNEHNVTVLQHAQAMGHTATAQLLRRAMKAVAPPPPPMLSDSPELMLGRTVSIIGLPELNGRRGKAARYDDVKDCLDIVLEGGARVVMVKPNNLRLYEKPGTQAAAASGAAPASAGSTHEAASLARRGLLSVLLPSRDHAGRDAARSQPGCYEDHSYEDSLEDSSAELPPNVPLACSNPAA